MPTWGYSYWSGDRRTLEERERDEMKARRSDRRRARRAKRSK